MGLIDEALRAMRKLPRPPFASQAYWEQVYLKRAGEHAIEWGLTPEQLFSYKYRSVFPLHQGVRAGSLEEHVGKQDDVLVIGCGNSMLGEFMCMNGWGKISSVDFSDACIAQAKRRSVQAGIDIEFKVADARRLHEHFPSNRFDSMVDKGLLDAMYSSSEAEETVRDTKDSVLRVLRPGGRYLAIFNGGAMGLFPPTLAHEMMQDTRWKHTELRRLDPVSDGVFISVWEKLGTPYRKEGENGTKRRRVSRR